MNNSTPTPTIKTTHPSWGEIPPGDEELNAKFQPLFVLIAQEAVKREKNRELPYQAVDWLREVRFGALRVPKKFGGFGATIRQLFRLMVQLGEADSNLPQIFRAHFAFVEGRLNHEDQESSAQWYRRIAEGDLFGAAMSERSDVTGGNATLVKEDGQWILNGEKYYCTGAIYADWIAAAGKEGEDRISAVVSAKACGVTRLDDWDGFGQRLTASGTTKFNRVPVAEENILRRFTGENRQSDYIKAFYQEVLLSTLAGIGRAIVRDGVDFVRPRTRAFGIPGNSSPRTDPLVQRVIGRVSSLAFAAETIVDGLAQSLDEIFQGYLRGEATEELYTQTEIKAYQAQQVVIDLILQAATLVFEVGGASATSENLRLDRHWRNARTVSSHNPAILRERAIGDYLLNGTLPDTAWAEGIRKAKEQKAREKEEFDRQTRSLADSAPGDSSEDSHPNGSSILPSAEVPRRELASLH